MMITSANKLTIQAILGKQDSGVEYIYQIPPYQRAYSWNQAQWESLFTDIEESETEYFLGSMICIVDNEKKGDAFVAQVIDGQQRLTTLNILLLEIYSKLAYLNKMPVCQAIYIDNDEYQVALLGLKKFFRTNNNIRLIPSIQNNNLDDYIYLISQKLDVNNVDEPKKYTTRKIYKCSTFFDKRITDFLDDKVKRRQNSGDDKAINIIQFEELFVLLEKITSALMVRIDTQDEQSAFILFESINNRGLPLSAIDLIKNKIIKEIADKPDETNEKWQKIVNHLHHDTKIQERFLRQFYLAFSGSLNLKVENSSKITKSNLIHIYSKMIKKQPEIVLNHLIKQSQVYENFAFPNDIEKSSPFFAYKNKLIDLKELGISAAHTLLLSVTHHFPNQDLSELLNYLEQWFIVRHLSNTPATNKLDGIFTNIANMFQTNETYSFQSIKQELDTHLPARAIVEKILLEDDIYEMGGICRNLLIYLEHQKQNKETQVDLWEKTGDKWVWTIEHIYPQAPENITEWSDDCQAHLHQLGNLTLSAYNPKLSNKSFQYKSDLKDENGKNIGLQSGNVKLNQSLIGKTEWTAQDIQNRSKELANDFLDSLYKVA